jgi:hypothetical protein
MRVPAGLRHRIALHTPRRSGWNAIPLAAVRETIFVSEETRSAFTSTQLRDLRPRLVLLSDYQ